jgi:hypothetical protein
MIVKKLNATAKFQSEPRLLLMVKTPSVELKATTLDAIQAYMKLTLILLKLKLIKLKSTETFKD